MDTLSVATDGYISKVNLPLSIATNGYLSTFAIIVIPVRKRGSSSDGEKYEIDDIRVRQVREDEEILVIIQIFMSVWDSQNVLN